MRAAATGAMNKVPTLLAQSEHGIPPNQRPLEYRNLAL